LAELSDLRVSIFQDSNKLQDPTNSSCLPLDEDGRPSSWETKESSSVGVRKVWRLGSSGEYATCLRARTCFEIGSYPLTRTVPEDARISPSISLMQVVFPDPLGPRKPTTCPFWTSRSTGPIVLLP